MLEKDMCYLVYGVGKATQHKLNTSLSTVISDNITLFYNKVPLSEFSEANLTKNLKDTNWLESEVLEFQKQMNILLQQTPVLPFRFGTVYSSLESMRQFLSTYYDSFLENLNTIASKSEWGVKIFLSRNNFSKWLILEADIRSSQVETTSPGANFFNRKKVENKMQEQEDEKLNELLRKIVSEIKTITTNCKEIDFLEGFEENGSSLRPVLSLAILLSENKSQKMHSLVSKLTKRYKPAGLVLRLSGPWPAYNFVRIGG